MQRTLAWDMMVTGFRLNKGETGQRMNGELPCLWELKQYITLQGKKNE